MFQSVPIVILAGGQATRLDGIDKSQIKLDEQTTLLDLILHSAKQVSPLIAINSNKDPIGYRAYEVPVFQDIQPLLGPLGGILSAMVWAKTYHPQATAVLTIAGDTPFIPAHFLQQLCERHTGERTKIFIAHDGKRPQPTIGLWPIEFEKQLQKALSQDVRKIMAFVKACHYEFVNCSALKKDGLSINPFMNINRREDIERAKEIYRQLELMT